MNKPAAELDAATDSSSRVSSLPATTESKMTYVGAAAAMLVLGGLGAWIFRPKPVIEPAPTETTTAGSAAAIPAEPADLSVQASVADAKMTFRGATVALPYHAPVTQGSSPELIEISAPGHQARRLWIKIDQGRSLNIALPKGSGSEDATYEETLIALGSMAPEPVAPTANSSQPAPGVARRGAARNEPKPKDPPPAAVPASPPPVAATPTPPPAAPPAAPLGLDKGDPWK